MPKTKKKSKKNSLLNWLGSNSPKNRLVLFVLAFAIVAGGYMLYRSFAESSIDLLYTQATFNNTSANITIWKNSSLAYSSTGSGNTLVYYSDSGSGLATSGRYSPNHNFIAWTYFANGKTNSIMYIKNLSGTTSKSSSSTKTYAMPTNEILYSSGSYSYFAWSPDSTKIVMLTQAYNGGNYKLRVLDTTSGAFSLVSIIPTNTSGPNPINGLTFLGDNQTIVYTDPQGVKQVKPNTTTPVLIRTQANCGKVWARPGTQLEFIYTCNTTNTATKIFKQSTSTSPVLIYTANHVYKLGSNEVFLSDFAPSSDGTKIALYIDEWDISSNNLCNQTKSTRISTMNYSGKGDGGGAPDDRIQVENPSVSTECGGKGGLGPMNLLAWSPDNQSIAYLGSPTESNALNGSKSLYVAPSNQYASYVNANYYVSDSPNGYASLVAKNVQDVSW